MRRSWTVEPYEQVVFYPRLVRCVRIVRYGIPAAVFLVTLMVFGSWWPWVVLLAPVFAFAAWYVARSTFPWAGSDQRLRFDVATFGWDGAERFRRLARRLRDRGEHRELEWLLTSTIPHISSVPMSQRDLECYRIHADLLITQGRTEDLAALRATALAHGALSVDSLGDPVERAAVLELLRAMWESETAGGRAVDTYIQLLRADEAHEELVPVLRKALQQEPLERKHYLTGPLADALRHLGLDAEADEVLRNYEDEVLRNRAEVQAQQDRAVPRSVVSSGYYHPSISTAAYSWTGYSGGGGGDCGGGGGYSGGGGGGGGC